jgi:hypothetical protein
MATRCWNNPERAGQTISFRVFRWQTNIFPTLTRIEAVHFTRPQYTAAMIAGARFLLYSKDPAAGPEFFKTVLAFPSIPSFSCGTSPCSTFAVDG